MILQKKVPSSSKLHPNILTEEDEIIKTKEFDAAIAESRAYEESQKEEAIMRRVRLEDAAKKRRECFEKLNIATMKRVNETLDGNSDDALAQLGAILFDYENESKRIDQIAPSGKLRLKNEMPLCYVCREFHGIAEMNGMCSRCKVLKTSAKDHQLISETSCAAAISRVFHSAGRHQHRRKKLPAPPSVQATINGRKLLEARLANYGRKIYQVKGDGACQFRAIAHQLFDHSKHHAIVRDRALRYLHEHPPLFHDCEIYVSPRLPFGTGKNHAVSVVSVGEDFSKYCKIMAQDSAWGDATTLQAIASVFRVRILLLTSHSANFEIVVEPDPTHCEAAVREIWIGFFAEMHYVSVVSDFDSPAFRQAPAPNTAKSEQNIPAKNAPTLSDDTTHKKTMADEEDDHERRNIKITPPTSNQEEAAVKSNNSE
mmetsp:Transcript_18401/g.23941  ORF Transcript_18401/g.23941 Transcript_18401/m.23941 type:complete len:428 (-) Transcript_18401:2669-3952(-)